MTPTISSSLQVALIGSGQVATHLALAFERAGHRVPVVYSRQIAHAEKLAAQLQQATVTIHLDFRQMPAADVYLVCVTDAAVIPVLEQAQFPAASLVVHTSGTLPIPELAAKDSGLQSGVFYPIQTFSFHQPPDLAQTPIALEAENPAARVTLALLAGSVSEKVVFLNSAKRKRLHLAAVFACNFTNHLLGISQELLTQHNLDPTLLHPLINTTIQKTFAHHPFTVQTGPAVREDTNILQEHLRLLQDPVYEQIYSVLSGSIQRKN
jgi:predicted short-subunit dehydrogenase-like oxidoreductase (DUF2520 family)